MPMRNFTVTGMSVPSVARRQSSGGVRLTAQEHRRFLASMATWMLSQFLHGEQGALFAAAQVTEAVQFFDGSHWLLSLSPELFVSLKGGADGYAAR